METPSRQSIDSPSPPAGPIPVFDGQLRVLSDSYLSFFQERRRIEETYAESLIKLHRKIKSLDSFLDERGDLSTARSAWSEVRDNVEREAQARHAFINTLTDDVIKPLTTLKETQERTRKRIKEDLKSASQAYFEYLDTTLPRMKAKYTRKFTEVEDSKRSAGPLSSVSPVLPPEQLSPVSSRPQVTSPQPLRALDRRPSGSGPGGRNRSPSSSTAFSDLAHQGKRQLNSLMTLLDKGGGSVQERLAGGKENNALRSVRAKRELDEADKEYRAGVHWLETLRLRRNKTIESGYNSLTLFVEECSAVIKQVLTKYSDNAAATYTTETQLCAHGRSIVEKVSPEKDKLRLTATIPRSLAAAMTDPVLYEHGFVGECNDLIFGFGLVDYAFTKGLPDNEIPRIVRICIREIDKRGLDCEGIYRVSGRHAIVQALQHEVEKDESSFQFSPQHDIYAVGSLLKLYLRELPEPIFKFPLQDRVQHTEDLAEHRSNNFVLLRSKIRRLPPVHQATLKAVIEHLSRVVTHFEKNKMDPKNLAIVFGSVVFGEDDIPKVTDLLSFQSMKDSMMEDLIINAKALFEDTRSGSPPPAPPVEEVVSPRLPPPPPLPAPSQPEKQNQSHPLPPTPPGEPTRYPYGSRTTKVALPAGPEDFTPPLPPRPTSSIHPSARSGSPTKEHFPTSPPPPPPRKIEAPSSPSVTSTIFESDTPAENAESDSADMTSGTDIETNHSPIHEVHDETKAGNKE